MPDGQSPVHALWALRPQGEWMLNLRGWDVVIGAVALEN